MKWSEHQRRMEEGLRKAMASGKRVGRPPANISWKTVEKLKTKGVSVKSICKILDISTKTYYNKLKLRRDD